MRLGLAAKSETNANNRSPNFWVTVKDLPRGFYWREVLAAAINASIIC